MLRTYPSAGEAFDFLGTSALAFGLFAELTLTFQPPLTEAQALYAFQGMDLNRDHLVVRAEFAEVVRSGHFFPTTEELRAASAHRRRRRRPSPTSPPLPRRPSVSMREFRQRLATSGGGPSLEKAFKSWDADSDGQVSLPEFRRSMAGLRPPLSLEEASLVFRGLDADGDALLVPDELQQDFRAGHFFASVSELEAAQHGAAGALTA